jgi:hypothetical protein
VMDAMHLFNTRANTNKNKSAENEWTLSSVVIITG